jgi:hypothetical protein
MSTQQPWLIPIVRPQSWRLVVERLAELGVPAYFPVCPISRRKTALMFGSYGFVQPNGYGGHLAKEVPGLRGFLRDGQGRLARLSEAAIMTVRTLEAELGVRRPFKVGDRVRVDGEAPYAWRNFVGVVERLAPADKIVVRLLIGKVTMPQAWIEHA